MGRSEMGSYDEGFFDYTTRQTRICAGVIIPILQQALEVDSVADIGSGTGAWAATWKQLGASTVVAVDGDYVDRAALLIEDREFVSHDLNTDLDLGRRFDLVQSLEVAEHLAPETSGRFVAMLVRHSDVVFFSAAVPGQGGEHHINERPLEYWRGLFATHGYSPLDLVRPRIADRSEVSFWFRYNPILYVSRSKLAALPEEVSATHVADGATIPDPSPAGYRLRKALLRHLPISWVTWLAATRRRNL